MFVSACEKYFFLFFQVLPIAVLALENIFPPAYILSISSFWIFTKFQRKLYYKIERRLVMFFL